MAIDPEDANTVYLRVTNGGLSDSVGSPPTAASRSTPPLTINGQFSSFLRASDGTSTSATLAGTLYVRAPARPTSPTIPGRTSAASDSAPATSRIFACGDMGIDGFSVGYSDDSGQTFQRMMSFIDLLGPLTCAPVADNCAAHWERIQGVLGIAPPPDAGPGGGGPDAGPPPMPGPQPPPNPGQPEVRLLHRPVATGLCFWVCSSYFSSGG